MCILVPPLFPGQGKILGYRRTAAVRSGCGCERSFVFIRMKVAYWRTGAVRGAGMPAQAVDSERVKSGVTVSQLHKVCDVVWFPNRNSLILVGLSPLHSFTARKRQICMGVRVQPWGGRRSSDPLHADSARRARLRADFRGGTAQPPIWRFLAGPPRSAPGGTSFQTRIL